MELNAIGIDLGKTLFHLVGLDASGNVVVRKRCSRAQLLKYTAKCASNESVWKPVAVRIFWDEPCGNKVTMPD